MLGGLELQRQLGYHGAGGKQGEHDNECELLGAFGRVRAIRDPDGNGERDREWLRHTNRDSAIRLQHGWQYVHQHRKRTDSQQRFGEPDDRRFAYGHSEGASDILGRLELQQQLGYHGADGKQGEHDNERELLGAFGGVRAIRDPDGNGE